MKQANFVVFFFLAAAFLAVLTGCPVTPSDRDQGINPPGDAGPDSDGNIDVDGGTPDEGVLPDSGMDTGTDAGPNVCADPEYVGNECNLPEGVVYSRDAFLCASALDWDQWISDEVGATPARVSSYEEGGVLYLSLSFASGNSGATRPIGTTAWLTCGPEGACWYNNANMSSNYGRCRVSFPADCSTATIECLLPGTSVPIVNHAVYVGPA